MYSDQKRNREPPAWYLCQNSGRAQSWQMFKAAQVQAGGRHREVGAYAATIPMQATKIVMSQAFSQLSRNFFL